MPLQYTTINVPFGFGVDESTHAFALQRPMLQALENGRIDKTGAISKRLGWAAEGGYTGQPGAYMASLNDRILLFNRSTFVSNPLSLGIYNAGGNSDARVWPQTGYGGTQGISEAYVLGRESIEQPTWNWDETQAEYVATRPDFGYEPTNNIVVYVWEQMLGDESASRRIYASVLDATTRQPLMPIKDISAAAVAGALPGSTLVRPRVVRQGTQLFVVFGKITGTNGIWCAQFDCGTKSWSAAVNIASDWDGTTFDVYEFVGSEATNWFMSYTRTTATDLHIQKMNGTAVVAFNSVLGGHFGAHCIYPVFGGNVWVAWYDDTPRVQYSTFDTGLVGTTGGGIVENGIDPELGAEQILQMGMTTIPYAFGSPTDMVGLFWTSGARLRYGGGGAAFPVSKFCRIQTNGTVSTKSRRQGLEMITRPYASPNGVIYANYVYDRAIVASSDSIIETQEQSRGFTTAFTIAVVDATTLHFGTINDAIPGAWRCCATWGIGEASRRNAPDSAGTMRHMGANAGFGLAGTNGTLEFPFQSFLEGGVTDSTTATPIGNWGVHACRMVIDDDSDIPVYATTIGNNVVLSGGTPSVYDGQTVTEYGFLWPPEYGFLGTLGSGGHLTAGDYEVAVTWRYQHATGDMCESIPITMRVKGTALSSITVINNDTIQISLANLSLTKKYNDTATTIGVAGAELGETSFALSMQAYRTTVGGSSFYSEGQGQRFASVPNDVYRVDNQDGGSSFTLFQVTQFDSVAQAQANIYTTGGILPNYPPPSLTHLCTHRGRVFGISAENPKDLVFTHIYEPGDLPGWHPDLVLTMPEKAYALASLDEKLIVFCEKGIYVIAGTGPDRKGLNSDYTEPQRLNAPHGTTEPKAVVSYPDGIFFYANEITAAGVPSIFLLDRKLNVTRIGGPVEDNLSTFKYCRGAIVDFVNERIYWAFCDAQLVRSVTSGAVIVYDWRHKAWMTDSVFHKDEGGNTLSTAIVGLGILNGTAYSTMPFDANIYRHSGSADPGGAYVSTIAITAWLPLSQIQAFQRYRWLSLLAQRVGAHALTVSVSNDYDQTILVGGFTQKWTWTDAEISALTYDHLKMHISHQRATAIAVLVQDSDSGSGPSAGFTLTGLAIEAGLKSPLAKLPQAGMKG